MTYCNPHNDAHQWGVWKENGDFGEVRYCLDCDEVEHQSIDATFMRDGSEPCEVCGFERTAELVRREDGEVIHTYCANTDCERNAWL